MEILMCVPGLAKGRNSNKAKAFFNLLAAQYLIVD